jgi:hypothetical protein
MMVSITLIVILIFLLAINVVLKLNVVVNSRVINRGYFWQFSMLKNMMVLLLIRFIRRMD